MMIIIKLFIAKIQKKNCFLTPKVKLFTIFAPKSYILPRNNIKKTMAEKSMVILMTPIANT